MRKVAVTGFILTLVMVFVTCDPDFPEEGLEYTDVVYSVDDSEGLTQVTVYLDGTLIPVTKQQRAMSRDLAKMAYDYFEVIFIGPTTTAVATLPKQPIARSSWDLGQNAGISGVYRGPRGEGYDFAWQEDFVPEEASDTQGVAIIFVGRKDGKTLLGVGKIGDVDHKVRDDPDATYDNVGFPDSPETVITDATKSVTFYVSPVKTGLLIGAETTDYLEDGINNPYNIKADSFKFVDGDDGTWEKPSDIPGWIKEDHSSRSPLGGNNYPMYSLPLMRDTPPPPNRIRNPYQNAEYTFHGAVAEYKKQIRLNLNLERDVVIVDKRFPRYLQGGRYWQPKENIDTDTTVKLDTVRYQAAHSAAYGDITGYVDGEVIAGYPILNVIPIQFQTFWTGIFSFYIEMSVYMITKEESTNGVLEAEVWKIRTGLGSELYSLDAGKSSGGCVLMGVGVTSLDWLEIEWEWLRNPTMP